MQNPILPAVVAICSTRALNWISRLIAPAKVLGLALALVALGSPQRAVALASPFSLGLAWDPNPESWLVGYRIYYGVASRQYTNHVDTGPATFGLVTGLIRGVTYYFAVTAYDANGQESDLSAEVVYAPPVAQVLATVWPGGLVGVKVLGQAIHAYNILATQNLVDWTVIGTTVTGADGTAIFMDFSAVNFNRRFYRAQDNQP